MASRESFRSGCLRSQSACWSPCSCLARKMTDHSAASLPQSDRSRFRSWERQRADRSRRGPCTTCRKIQSRVPRRSETCCTEGARTRSRCPANACREPSSRCRRFDNYWFQLPSDCCPRRRLTYRPKNSAPASHRIWDRWQSPRRECQVARASRGPHPNSAHRRRAATNQNGRCSRWTTIGCAFRRGRLDATDCSPGRRSQLPPMDWEACQAGR